MYEQVYIFMETKENQLMGFRDLVHTGGQVENSEISEMSEISENYLRVFHLRVFVLALYAKVENSEMFGNPLETSLNCLFHTV